MAKYKVRLDCEVAGIWRTTEEEFELSDAAAKHLLPPHGNVIMAVSDLPKPVATATRKPAAKVTDSDG